MLLTSRPEKEELQFANRHREGDVLSQSKETIC